MVGSVTLSIASIRKAFAASPRARILFWATLIGLIVGALEIGMPAERLMHNIRDTVRARSADGSIVVVEVNDRTQQEVDALGSHRAVDAAVLERLFKLGAKRVFFDKLYMYPSTTDDDTILAATSGRYRGRVFLGTRWQQNRSTGALEPLLPIPVLRRSANLGAINAWRDALGYTSRIPYLSEIGGKAYPAFSALLAGVHVRSFDTYSPDYAIRYNTIPTVNFLDVLHGRPAAHIVAGRDVILGKTADAAGDTHSVPGQGPIPGVYVHVIGAQTLKTGVPIQAGWLPLFGAALLIAGGYIFVPLHRAVQRMAVPLTLIIFLVGPIALDAWHVDADVVPALLLLGTVFVRVHILQRAARNPLTGLPTLDSILRDGGVSSLALVAVKVGNYADLRATLSDAEERHLIDEVLRRLRVGGEPTEMMHAGDTFVWKTGLPVDAALFEHLEGLHALLSSPVQVGGRMVDLTIGIGVENGFDRPLTNRVGSLQVSAGEALASGAKYRVHDPRHLEDADFRQSLLSRLDLALENGEIWVAYQPKLDLHSKRVTGAEALVRWLHPERGPITPDQFIPAAEQANRIAGLTLFVLETAIRDARRLESIDRRFTVAVNLSVRMLTYPGLPQIVGALLARHGLAAERLTLEITESEEIDPSGAHLRTLNALRALGVELSIDDYGTKFSTLDYVRQLPASEIKIDQRFVGSVHIDRNAWIMARSTIELAHSLGLSVVAEGVELLETMRALDEMGCDVVQGYLIGRPVRYDDLQRFLAHTHLYQVA